MSSLFKFIASVLAALIAGTCLADDQVTELPEPTRALLAKERARQQQFKGGQNSLAGSANASSNGCSIQIGNVDNRPGARTRENVVIITQPIIQAPNKSCN